MALLNYFDRKEAVQRINEVNDAVCLDINAERTFLVKLLLPGQIRMLQLPIINMINTQHPKMRFYFGFLRTVSTAAPENLA